MLLTNFLDDQESKISTGIQNSNWSLISQKTEMKTFLTTLMKFWIHTCKNFWVRKSNRRQKSFNGGNEWYHKNFDLLLVNFNFLNTSLSHFVNLNNCLWSLNLLLFHFNWSFSNLLIYSEIPCSYPKLSFPK